jgi:DNA-binding beta-propeller fold protein YncE
MFSGLLTPETAQVGGGLKRRLSRADGCNRLPGWSVLLFNQLIAASRFTTSRTAMKIKQMKIKNMKSNLSGLTGLLALGSLVASASVSFAQPSPRQLPVLTPNDYKIVNSTKVMGSGGTDYVYADNADRQIYIPRGSQVLVFDEDTLKLVGSITNARARGVAVDSKSGHGFCSSSPVVMWDTKTLETIKTIPVEGGPDGILFEPLTERIYVFSHRAPNATVIDGKDGTVIGTIDLGGQPEQAQSDGAGHMYIDLEDKDQIAVVDVNTLKVTAKYDLAGKGGGPGGLGLDAKNHILFAMCHDPATCVVMSADDGKILATLPIGNRTDGGGFNPATMEAFSSQGDGTLTIIKENSPTDFAVEQTVTTKPGARTSTLDTKNNRIILITIEPAPSTNAAPATVATTAAAATPATGTNPPAGGRRGGRGGGFGGGPGLLDILVVGRQ